MRNNSLLAFVHIEKAAGTSLIHILRRNFLLRYLDARPVRRSVDQIFMSEDMQTALQINPFLECIGGHSVKPYSDLDQSHQLRYITLLRDPVERYISHHRYWNERLGRSVGISEFLDMDDMSNFQTKKIAGVADLDLAKRVLADKFFLVGVVESFDEFLVILKAMLGKSSFSIEYSSRNVASGKHSTRDVVSCYRDEIVEKNKLDIELYNFVRYELCPHYRELCLIDLDVQAIPSIRVQKLSSGQAFRSYIDYVYRKSYCEPVVGFRRMLSGRSYSGQY